MPPRPPICVTLRLLAPRRCPPPFRVLRLEVTSLPLGHLRHRPIPRFASTSSDPKPREEGAVVGDTDISHSTFLSSASSTSDFNPTQSPWAGQDGIRDPGKGHLEPTKSHLFKLILPLPTSLSSSSRPRRPTAFLLHPSQPLSHLSRLITGSLPPAERDVEITYLALTGPEESVESRLRDAEEDEPEERGAEGQEGGPILGEREPDAGKFQEVSWSSSTDLSDFIKQSCLNERFHINLRRARAADEKRDEEEEGRAASEVEKEGLTLEVVIPSFASRTTYLRTRLLRLTRELDTLTKQKKAIDLAAHKGAQRLAVGALGIGVAYWVAIIRWTFFTDAGWDLMEPVTWATGFGALLCSAGFLVYHNREVSYSSLLDLSVTARQKRLYDQHGLDIDRWTEMVAEAKTLRKEIERIAKDYDLEWKGELENLARDSQPLEQRLRARRSSEAKAAKQSSAEGADAESSEAKKQEDGEEDEGEEDEHLDIDKTIDEASEMAEQSKESQEKEKAAQRKGDARDDSKAKGSKSNGGEKKGDSERRGEEKAKKLIDKK